MMTQPRTFHLLGNLLHFHAFSSETGGHYCVVEAKTAPGAGAPPNHHKGEQECFYVLEGTFEFMIEGKTRQAGPGEFVAIPDGAVHAFTNVGSAPGRVIIINSPGAMHDAFFSSAGEALPEGTTDIPAPNGAPDIPHVLSTAQAAGMTILPPQ